MDERADVARFVADEEAAGCVVSRYSVLRRGASVRAEIERRGSRFAGVLTRVESPAEARAVLAELRRHHHDARHHCSAWLIGPDRGVTRSSDDGEPAGTAGAPMLTALSGARMPTGAMDLSDTMAVVVRWFGGTLLGTGGLVSAYTDAVQAALAQAAELGAVTSRVRTRAMALDVPFAEVGRWQNELRRGGVDVLQADYASRRDCAVLVVGGAGRACGPGQLPQPGIRTLRGQHHAPRRRPRVVRGLRALPCSA